jgi:hypothetical protein
MFGLLDVRHMRRIFAPEKEITRHGRGDRDRCDQKAPPEAVADHASAARDELAVFGLVAAGAERPASLNSIDDLSHREGLEAISLLRTGAPKPKGQESLADASPYDFLMYMGLLG